MFNKEKIDLYFGLFEKGIFHEIYSDISYSYTDDSIDGLTQIETKNSKNRNVYIVKYVPEYLNANLKKQFRAIRFFEIRGYAISLNKVSSIEEYLTKQTKRKFRTSVIRRKNRLESCFNIRYEVHQNQISRKEYSFLMAALHNLLVRRFNQRKETNKRLLEWDKFYELFFAKINSGKASLFVIYESNRPIAVSLNYHLDRIFFGAISSYDIDYAKFGLGQVLVYKRLEWCIQNGFKIFDLSMGNPEYKMKWCNKEYNFENHIVYSPLSLSSTFYAKTIAQGMSIKNYLKSKNGHIFYRKIRKTLMGFVRRTNKEPATHKVKYKLQAVNSEKHYENLAKVDFNEESFSFLKPYVCEFLYATDEHISKTEVFEVDKGKAYLIKGGDSTKSVLKAI